MEERTDPVGGGDPGSDNTTLPEGHALAVGARLRIARQLRGATLREIADQAGLSESYLSQLERGRAHGSIGSLVRLSDVLGVTMAELFLPDLGDRPRLTRASARQWVERENGARKALLTARPFQHLQVFIGEFAPGGSTGPEAYAHGDSEELLLVLEGQVVLELKDETFDLAKGDSVFYRSSTPHRLSNPHDTDAQVMWAISPPT